MIEVVLEREELEAKEQFWIDTFKSCSENNYNIKERASRILKVSDETKERLRDRALSRIFTYEMKQISIQNLKKTKPTLESRRKTAEKLRGRKRPEEVKEKIRLKLIGREVTKETREKISRSIKGIKHTKEAKENMKKGQIASLSKNGGSKLKEHEVAKIKLLLKENISPKDIASKFNITRSLVYKIKNKKVWSHIS